jgi:hypothetical protein
MFGLSAKDILGKIVSISVYIYEHVHSSVLASVSKLRNASVNARERSRILFEFTTGTFASYTGA